MGNWLVRVGDDATKIIKATRDAIVMAGALTICLWQGINAPFQTTNTAHHGAMDPTIITVICVMMMEDIKSYSYLVITFLIELI